jgi:SAM-dependent methyltransferase
VNHAHTHFDDVAAVYDESLPAHVVEHYLRRRSEYVASVCPPGADVLDVGCGTGTLAARLAAAGYNVTGVDPSEGMLEVLRARGSSVRAVQGSGTALPFADDSFDLVMCVAVMHHVAQPDDVRRTLAEMVRVARTAGLILIWDHNPRNPYWGRLMARVPQDTGDERLISEAELVSGLRAGGAELVRSEQLGWMPDFVPPRFLPAMARAERGLERLAYVRRLSAHNVVLARKDAAAQPRDTSSATTSPLGSR